MTENLFSKSDMGSKAAWKGFSSQTIYIAYRLINLQDSYNFYPEQVEDLLIMNDDIAEEVIQIKNLSSNLSLSNLKPGESDSFFRRCLSYKGSSPNTILKIVSFGEVGPELANLNKKESVYFKRVKEKLLTNGYTDDEIDWISRQLIIEKVDEEKLLSFINIYLKESVETMAAPNVFLDVLTQYVANLSRYSDYTTKRLWQEKIQQIGIDLATIRGVAKEYGNSILPLAEYKEIGNREKLKEEYYAGINAHPQHIRMNLDIERTYWVEQIHNYFSEEKLVIIKGASGQGKSSLSYRYLHNHYSENDVICIESVTGEEQAQNIIIALNGLAKNRNNLIVYYDVSPKDLNWTWICEKHNAYGANFKLLVSIREEDFRRANFDSSQIPLKFINLSLSKEEAEFLFHRYPNSEYRSFEEAWKYFGEKGPLMEFTYMLNQSDTLKQKLTSQIRQISMRKDYSEEWLEVLLIVSYAGKFGIEINAKKLFSNISIKNKGKMIYLLEREYLLRVSTDNKKINSLHVLRANIISEVLLDFLFADEKDVISKILNSVNESVLFMLTSYYYDNDIDEEFICVLKNINYDSWKCYSSVVRSLIWYELMNFYLANQQVIFELDEIMPGKFPMLLLGDVTGLYPHYNGKELFDTIREHQPDRVEKMEKLLDSIKTRSLGYTTVDEFMGGTVDKLPICRGVDLEEFNSAGYGLFWLALRGFYVDKGIICLPEGIENNGEYLDALLNLLVGIQQQKLTEVYEGIFLKLLEQIKNRYAIVYLSENEDMYEAVCIINVYDKEKSEIQFGNEYIMSIVGALRRLSINKKQYNVKLIGGQLIDNVKVPEMVKTINEKNLPWLWITEINGWLRKLHEYKLLPDTWEIAKQSMRDCVRQNMEILNTLEKAIEHLYKKGNTGSMNLKKLVEKINVVMTSLNNEYLYYPKTSVDRFGIDNTKVIVKQSNSPMTQTNTPLLSNNIQKKRKSFNDLFAEFRRNLGTFYKNMNSLLIERVKHEEVSHSSRISYINIVNALDIINKLNYLYHEEFPMEKESIISSKDYYQFQLFSSIWHRLYKGKLRIERSMLYEQKEYIKRYQRRINTFLEKTIANYIGVLEVKKFNDKFEVIIDFSSIENVFNQLVEDFQTTFPEIEVYTFENSMWNATFNYIFITTSFLEYKVPPSYKLESDKFAYIKDVNSLMLSTKNSEQVKIESNILDAFFRYNALKPELHTIFKHTSQVNQFLKQKENDEFFNKDIFEEWNKNMTYYTINILNQILSNINLVKKEILYDFGESKNLDGIMNEIEEIDGIFKANLKFLLSSNDQDKGDDYIRRLFELIENFTEINQDYIAALVLSD
ncbi:hypothetical protein U2I83_05500 [Bacillus amyloliquefaciens]|uniref:hypothetical protein n=1 Tax=Bacillus amyloliquefaciens TaxID=1390 RepID=UPI0032E04E7C